MVLFYSYDHGYQLQLVISMGFYILLMFFFSAYNWSMATTDRIYHESKTIHSENMVQKIIFWSRRGKHCPKRSTEGCEGCDSQHGISRRSDLDPKMEVR